MKGELLFIVGPTASGKTELALQEAIQRKAVILSCDSLCFYRHMDIGTAKPGKREQALVPHYGIDLIDPDQTYSISHYIDYTRRVLDKLSARRQPAIVVGGSGFYLKSFFEPVVDEIQVSDEVVSHVEKLGREGGLDRLLKELERVNPENESFEGLDKDNPRRVEKALMRCLGSGKAYSELRGEFLSLPKPFPEYDKEVWLIQRSSEELKVRNRKRVIAMLDSGLVEEVEKLRELGFERNPSACNAIGYREVLAYLDGAITANEMMEQIYVHTNQLMRKQRIWFQRQIPVHRKVVLQ